MQTTYRIKDKVIFIIKCCQQLIDRVLFTLAFLIGVQLPGFIQQYSQRLSGHLAEAENQLQQYQNLADLHFNGQLTQLVSRYQSNPDPAINEVAAIVSGLNR